MNVLVDTGVWYAFCDMREQPDRRGRLDDLLEGLRYMPIVVPWPVLYETVRTRFARNQDAMRRLDLALRRLRVSFLDHTSYNDDALQMSFDNALRSRPARPMSMVDCMLRLILDDVDVGITDFLTFNPKDFHDVCSRRRITLTQ